MAAGGGRSRGKQVLVAAGARIAGIGSSGDGSGNNGMWENGSREARCGCG